jgi:hypothetical protein
MTYSRRTENAKTTIAFSLNLMRSDHTSNSEMPKMNTSSATAVSSTPFHRRHCRGSDMSKLRMKLHHLPCQYTADHSAHSKALVICTGKLSQERILTLRWHSYTVRRMQRRDVSESRSNGCKASSWKLSRRMLLPGIAAWQRSQSVQLIVSIKDGRPLEQLEDETPLL